MKQQRLWVILVLALTLGLVLAACGGTEATVEEAAPAEAETEAEPAAETEAEAVDGEPLKVAFVYVAPIGDLRLRTDQIDLSDLNPFVSLESRFYPPRDSLAVGADIRPALHRLWLLEHGAPQLHDHPRLRALR